jgi:predicted ATP-binding protein involved in virulence
LQQEKNVLDFPAIVLIDNIELHLYPSWHQIILPILMNIFPNVQFIVTTYSPQVLTSVKPENIRKLVDNKIINITNSTFGAENKLVLEDIFGVSSRPPNKIKNLLTKYYNLINNNKGRSKEAINIRNELELYLFDDPMLRTADYFISQKEYLSIKDIKQLDKSE